MGFYINPKGMTKEAFLAEHGKELSLAEVSWPPKDDEALVCMVDNGPFRAAGIMVDEREFAQWGRPDHRPRKWFTLNKQLAIDNSDALEDDFEYGP